MFELNEVIKVSQLLNNICRWHSSYIIDSDLRMAGSEGDPNFALNNCPNCTDL